MRSALLKLDDGVKRPSAKLDRLMEMVLELLSEGRKIIVFSQFTSMLDLVRNRFDAERIRYSVLTGETRDRKKAIDGFQNGASDVFLVSLKAGGVGLNLTAADTVIIFDPWWNPAVEEQAIDRAHRIGQDKAVFVSGSWHQARSRKKWMNSRPGSAHSPTACSIARGRSRRLSRKKMCERCSMGNPQ